MQTCDRDRLWKTPSGDSRITAERIAEAVHEFAATQRQALTETFAKKHFRVSKRTLFRYMQPGADVPFSFAARLADAAKVRLDWLAGVDVPKYRDQTRTLAELDQDLGALLSHDLAADGGMIECVVNGEGARVFLLTTVRRFVKKLSQHARVTPTSQPTIEILRSVLDGWRDQDRRGEAPFPAAHFVDVVAVRSRCQT